MSLRHPRHRDGLHIRRYLIAVSGLDYPFEGLAPINIHPQHFQLRCYRLLFKASEPRLQRAPHSCDSNASIRCSSSSTSKVRRWASNNDVTACPSEGVIAPAPTASSTVPIALSESWEPSRAGRSSSMVPFPLYWKYAAQTKPQGR